MEKPTSDFYLTAKKIWGTVVKTDTNNSNALTLELELHKRLLNIFQAGSYYYLIFNIYQGAIEFISDGMNEVLGYNPDELSALFLMDNIHPDDKSYFLDFEYRIAAFFKTLPFDKIKNFKVQYDYRIKAKNNKYVRILHQAIQIDYDEDNFYRTLVLHTDISHIKQEGTPCFSIIGLDGEPSYYNVQDTPVFTKSYDLFTRREREILKLIVEGKSSKEIAGELYISLHAVNTHRKSILNKAGSKTPLDLLRKVISAGWV